MKRKGNDPKEITPYDILSTIERDLGHICGLRPENKRSSPICGAFVQNIRTDIDRFLQKDLKTCSVEERTVLRDCLGEIRKMLHLVQGCFGTKVSVLTIHSILSDMLKYLRRSRERLMLTRRPS